MLVVNIEHNEFYVSKGYFFKEEKNCIPLESYRKLTVKETRERGIMGHFGVEKTLCFFKDSESRNQMDRLGQQYKKNGYVISKQVDHL